MLATYPLPRTRPLVATSNAFLDALTIERCDVHGFSLGGMVAQEMALNRPSIFRRMILAGTGPRGGELMHLDTSRLAQYFNEPTLKGYAILQIFFAPTDSSQMAGAAFIERLSQRGEDRDPVSGPQVAAARQMFQYIATTLISGQRDAVLVDPPMTLEQAARVVDWVAASGKKRSGHIFVTHGHGDH